MIAKTVENKRVRPVNREEQIVINPGRVFIREQLQRATRLFEENSKPGTAEAIRGAKYKWESQIAQLKSLYGDLSEKKIKAGNKVFSESLITLEIKGDLPRSIKLYLTSKQSVADFNVFNIEGAFAKSLVGKEIGSLIKTQAFGDKEEDYIIKAID